VYNKHYLDYCFSVGSELEILPDLLYAGAFQHLDVLMVEYHQHLADESRIEKLDKLELAIDILSELNPNINVIKLDDETYSRDLPPALPIC